MRRYEKENSLGCHGLSVFWSAEGRVGARMPAGWELQGEGARGLQSPMESMAVSLGMSRDVCPVAIWLVYSSHNPGALSCR